MIGLDIITRLEFKPDDRFSLYYSKKNPYNVMIRKSTDGKGYKLFRADGSNVSTFAVYWQGQKIKLDNISMPVNFDIHENKSITIDLDKFADYINLLEDQ